MYRAFDVVTSGAGRRHDVVPPEHFLKDARMKAVVDYVDVRIISAKPTNYQFIQRKVMEALGTSADSVRPWVEAVDRTAGSAAKSFDVRIHDVSRAGDIERLFDRVGRLVQISEAPRIVRVEVAIDSVPCSDKTTLENLYLQLLGRFYADGSEPRQFDQDRGLTSRISLSGPRFDPDQTTYWGDGKGQIFWKAYIKKTDRGQNLPADACRVRLEVTLGDEALRELRIVFDDHPLGLHISKLTQHFKFREIALDDEGEGVFKAVRSWVRKMTLGRGVGSMESSPRPGKARRRKYAQMTRSDQYLAKRARHALNRLDRSYNKKPRSFSTARH